MQQVLNVPVYMSTYILHIINQLSQVRNKHITN